MKNRNITILAVLSLVAITTTISSLTYYSGNNSSKASTSETILTVEPELYEWGNIPLNKLATAEVVISNKTNKDIEILRITTSCSCTTAELTDGSVLPLTLKKGESKSIDIEFDPQFHKDQPLGDITREVYIKTNSEEQDELAIRLTGVVVEPQ